MSTTPAPHDAMRWIQPWPGPDRTWRRERRWGAINDTIQVVLTEDEDNWLVSVSVHGKPPNEEQLDCVRYGFCFGDAEVRPPTDEEQTLVLPKLPGEWPWGTTGAEFWRDAPGKPWRLHSLWTSNFIYDCGWNSKEKANLYADVGSGGSPYISKLVRDGGPIPNPEAGHWAVWSKTGEWRAGWETRDKPDPVDPVDLGYLVLDELPDLEMEECGRLQWCETCEEVQDFSGVGSSCEHVWHCRTAGERCGATGNPESPKPCVDEWCECNGRAATRRLYAVALLWSGGGQ